MQGGSVPSRAHQSPSEPLRVSSDYPPSGRTRTGSPPPQHLWDLLWQETSPLQEIKWASFYCGFLKKGTPFWSPQSYAASTLLHTQRRLPDGTPHLCIMFPRPSWPRACPVHLVQKCCPEGTWCGAQCRSQCPSLLLPSQARCRLRLQLFCFLS